MMMLMLYATEHFQLVGGNSLPGNVLSHAFIYSIYTVAKHWRGSAIWQHACINGLEDGTQQNYLIQLKTLTPSSFLGEKGQIFNDMPQPIMFI